MSSNEIQPLNIGDIDRAWRYHDAADSLLHTRLQALFVAQSFLVGAYVTLFSRWSENPNRVYPLLMLGILLFGLFSSGLLGRRIHYIGKGLRALKKNYLMHDGIYLDYLNAVRGGSGRGVSAGTFTVYVPLMFVVFWAVILVHWILSLCTYGWGQ